MVGTTEEIKQVIVEFLQTIYPRGHTKSGISVTCFKDRAGADGDPLIGFGDIAKLNKALDELVAEGTIISNDEDGEQVFHYKTDDRPPVVGHVEETKLAIIECLCGIYPKELIHTGIERECFKDEYKETLKRANGTPLVGIGDGVMIQRALKELVSEGKIDSYEKARDEKQMVHYRAKASSSMTSDKPMLRDMNLNIPEREDIHNEFKETFAVSMKGGKSNDVKMEVAKTVAAFANTKRGRLFIGVRDDGTPAGLKKDLKQYKNSTDQLELAIRNYVRSKLDKLVYMNMIFSREDYLVIVVTKHWDWVYVGEDFYVRDGNRSLKLSPKETSEYQKGKQL